MKAFKAICILAASAAVAGCTVPNDVSIEVLKAVPTQTDCTIDPGANAVGTALVDLSFANKSYAQGFALQNNMADTSDTSKFTDWRVNTADFVTQKTVVTYAGLNSTVTGTLSSLTSETPLGVTVQTGSQQAVDAILIPQNIGQAIYDNVLQGSCDATTGLCTGNSETVLATFQVQGQTLDGAKLSSGLFTFPITVCDGCLRPKCPMDTSGTNPVPTIDFLCGQSSDPWTCPGSTP